MATTTWEEQHLPQGTGYRLGSVCRHWPTDSRTSAIAAKFSRDNVWDLDKKENRDALIKKIRDEEPDHIVLSPECPLWSQMQEMNAKTPEDKERLKENRRKHHDVHLNFVKQIFVMQAEAGRHAHVEQPAYAKSWKTRALRD